MFKRLLQKIIAYALDIRVNPYHPLVWINGNPEIGANTYIGGFSEVYAKGANVHIGHDCDIASFVVINCADSHLHTLYGKEISRHNIFIANNVFIGTQSVILGNTTIGNHSVIGAGVVLQDVRIPPYSKVYRSKRGQLIIKKYHYAHH